MPPMPTSHRARLTPSHAPTPGNPSSHIRVQSARVHSVRVTCFYASYYHICRSKNPIKDLDFVKKWRQSRKHTLLIYYSMAAEYLLSIFIVWILLAFCCRFSKSKNPKVLIPLVPLTFIVGYIGDLAYGSKMDRMKGKNS